MAEAGAGDAPVKPERDKQLDQEQQLLQDLEPEDVSDTEITIDDFNIDPSILNLPTATASSGQWGSGGGFNTGIDKVISALEKGSSEGYERGRGRGYGRKQSSGYEEGGENEEGNQNFDSERGHYRGRGRGRGGRGRKP